MFFYIKSGVSEGSINRPKFFNCVMDELLYAMEEHHLGCFVNGLYAGAFAYADDLLLLSSSMVMLQQMLDLCTSIGIVYNLSFNSKKSVMGVVGIHFGKLASCLTLYGTDIEWSERFTYLGITFLFCVNLCVDVTSRLQKFHAAVCTVLKNKLAGFENVYVRLLVTKCMPILFYGMDSLTLSSNVLQTITKSWNMAFKWIYGLRKYDSTRLLLRSCNTMSAKFLLHQSSLLFYNTVSASKVPILRNLWLWCRSTESYTHMLRSYNLFDVESRAQIYGSVMMSFNAYCEE